MINATNDSKPRELVPAGSHLARCYSMIHLGTHEEEYMGEKKKQNKVRITFELPTEMRVFKENKGDQPMVISKEYTLSMYEKSNLRKELEGWRGKGLTESEAENFDITKLLGKPCLLSIIHRVSKTGKDYAMISSISAIPKGMTCPNQINENFEFNFSDKIDNLDLLPDFIKEKIKSADEFKSINNPTEHDLSTQEEEEINDLPF